MHKPRRLGPPRQGDHPEAGDGIQGGIRSELDEIGRSCAYGEENRVRSPDDADQAWNVFAP